MSNDTPQLPLFTTAPDAPTQEIPYGYCKCGCGQKTKISPQSSTIHKHVNGVPRDYLPGHSAKRHVSITLADVFWELCQKNAETDCWLWRGNINLNGYGTFQFRGKFYYAHRVSYEIHNDIKLSRKQVICHHCDNPVCTNPTHLFLGTQADNMTDMHQKKRHAYGERMGNAKLTEAVVREIRQLRAQGLLQREIAERLSIKKGTVGAVLRHKSWVHVT